ncbi:MAG: nitroreductase family protein, partial [Chloroflexota bacterium]|nr:nitroreductase family protein [Chloroflexota bacterium]
VMRDIMESAIRAPNGGNTQQWHFIVLKDADKRKQMGELYHEAWWAKRKDQGIMGPEDIPPGKNSQRSAMRLANEFGDAPVMVFICALAKGGANGIIPSSQNLLLAARAHGIGGTITTLHEVVDQRVKKLLNIPETAEIVYCLPLGYPRGEFGSVTRKPLEEVCGIDSWDVPYK